MSSVIDSIEQQQLRTVPRFQAGDRVRVHFQVIEGTRRRLQVFEGVVIRRQGHGARETFTVRKQSFGVGVERTFPLHSPKIEKLEIAARGDVRRAKLYYLRDRVGKRARVAERRWGAADDLVVPAETEALDAEGVSAEEAEVVEAPPEAEATDEAAAGERAAEENAEEPAEGDPPVPAVEAAEPAEDGPTGEGGDEESSDPEEASA